MRLLVIRHSQAAPARSRPDAERPLTSEGERRFRDAARGLARLVPSPDALLTSPVVRARQTAALAAAAWGLEPVVEDAVASGVDAILDLLHRYPRDASIVLIGHEPTVSGLVAQLTGMASTDGIAFEPGAAALLEIASLSAPNARLVWFLTPAAAAAR
jgi:phosphohistidine phosphatase